MNPNGNPGGPGDAWTYTVNALQTNPYTYLVLTEDTNKTTTPIKFAVPPFVGGAASTNIVAASSFDSAAPGNYTTTFKDGTNTWSVLTNQVSVVNDPANANSGSNFLALANGTVSTMLPTVPGATYTLTFQYRGPGIQGWWRAESNTVDSAYADNGTPVNGAGYTNGEVGSAFNFNGVNSYVQISDQPNLRMTKGMTLEAWVYPTSLGNYVNPAGKWDVV